MKISQFGTTLLATMAPSRWRTRKSTLRSSSRAAKRRAFFESLEDRRLLAAVLGIGTNALAGNDLTDIGNNGVEGSYSPPSNLAGFDGVFFSNTKSYFGSYQGAFNVFDNQAGGASDDKALWGFPVGQDQLQPMIVGADFRTTHGPRVLTSFTISSAEDTPGRDPRVWKIEGSNDTTSGLNGTWTTIYNHSVASSDWASRLQVNRYSPADGDAFLTSQPFTAFRMVTTATGIWTMGTVQGNNDLFQLSEIEFFGVPPVNYATVSIGDASVTEGGDLVFDLTLSNPINLDTVVTYSTQNGTATTANNDYTDQIGQTVTIPAGYTTSQITVQTTADNQTELDESLFVSLNSVSLNSSVVGEISLDLADIVGGGNGTGTGGSGGINPVTGAAVSSGVYGPISGSNVKNVYSLVPSSSFIDGVFIPDGGPTRGTAVRVSSTGITATGVGDSVDSSWDYIINGTPNLPYYYPISFSTTTEIRFATNKGLTFDLDAIEFANPGKGVSKFTALAALANTNSNGAEFTIMVDGIIRAQTYIRGGQSAPMSVAIDPDDRFLTLITTDGGSWSYDDNLWGDPTLVLSTLSQSVVLGDNQGLGTILNDDSARVSIGDAAVTEGGNLLFNVTLSNSVDVDTVITYSTANGTATTADMDYTGQTLQTLTIPAGQISGMITVATTDDNKVELDETMTVELTDVNASGRNVTIDDGSGQGTIENNDTASLIIDDVSRFEGDAPGMTVLTFTISIDPAGSGTTASQDITVVVNTSGVLATGGGVDFTDVVDQTVTIAAGTTSTTVMVSVERENLAELNETFQVNLSDAQFNGAVDATRVVIGDGAGLGTIKNDDFAPVANVGEPYVIDEGSSLTVDASASSDADVPADTLTYRWDVDGDGDYDENVTGVNPTLTLTQLLGLGLADGPHANNVTVEVSDGTNINTAQTTLTVNNVEPVLADLTNSSPDCGDAFMGVNPVAVTAKFTDVGLPDTHTVSINWGDGTLPEAGTVTETVGAGLGTVSGSHIYATGGIFTITVTLKDDDGGLITSTTTAIITGVGVVGNTLYVIGTDDDDHVTINQAGSVYKVHADFLTTGSFRDVPIAGISRIVVQTCGGNDHVTISGGVSLPALIDGGTGNDKLNGGNGPNIVLGGSGNDQINGGSARDILIGGIGADRLVGNGDEDILIAGWTDHDAFNPTSYYESLWSVMNEWNSSSTQDTRRSHLTGETGGGLNGSVQLNSATVHDDTDQDQLTSSSGNDWFFANLSEGSILDSITDKSISEFWEELL